MISGKFSALHHSPRILRAKATYDDMKPICTTSKFRSISAALVSSDFSARPLPTQPPAEGRG